MLVAAAFVVAYACVHINKPRPAPPPEKDSVLG